MTETHAKSIKKIIRLVKDENHMATIDIADGAMSNGCEPAGPSEQEWYQLLTKRRRLEWFEHVKRRDGTENIRAVAKMKMEGKRPRGRPRLIWKDTVRKRHESLEHQGGMGH